MLLGSSQKIPEPSIHADRSIYIQIFYHQNHILGEDGKRLSMGSRTSRCSRSGSNEPSRLTDPLYVPVRLVRSSSRVVFSPAILVTLPGDSRTPERKSLTVRVILQEKSGRNVAHPAGMGWRRSVGSESHHTSWRAPRCPCQAPDVPSSRYLHCFRRIVLYHRRR